LPTLIAYYNMDENSWNGTLNETKDSAGYTGGPFDGQGIGSPKPTAASINPAKASATGTCGYATLSGLTTNGSGFTLDGLPLDTSAGANTTVSFWMLWNGTNYVQPLGWNLYNLFFSDGKFGFNTGSYDIWGINSAGLANGWHHVVAVFNNGNVSNSQLYIDGVSQTLSQTNGSQIANSSAYVQSVLQVSGWTYDNAWRFVGGRIDEVKVYKGTLTQTQVTADYTAVHACAGFNVIPVDFNCVAVGAASNTGHLYTQVTASSFNFDVVALKADGTVETNYVASGSKNVTVEFVDGTGNTACSSRASINPAVSQSVTFSASDAGRKTISASITKAYRDLRCRVTDANQSPSVIGCSSDDFAVRPTSFTVSSNANADSTGTNVTATPTVKAGANFSMTAATGVAGYDGTPSIDNTKLSAHLGATQIGTLTGGFGAASTASGNATGAAFNYSEAGYFKFATNGVYDSSFTAVDSANGDCATGFSASGGKNACSFGNNSNTNYFGRFIPDHFVITPGTTTPSCGANFSYFGQDGFTTGFTLIAQNSSNSVTQNYTGGFAKLGLSTWSNYQFTAASLPLGATLSASATLLTGTWNNGSATVLAQHLISRPASAASPTSITISAAPVDSDGVTAASTAVSAASVFRYGRLAMPNIYGSELLPLTVNIEAQYWNGTAYQRNQLDNCSVVTLSSIAMGNYKSNLNACETQLSGAGTMVNGKSLVVLSKPGAGNNGSVDLSVNLNTASGATCNSNVATTATSAAIPWFGNANPNARATFGIYKSPVIYLRENF
jgi:hypothetical protein